jgi:peptidoglycan hydrolase-like protein with peptidoglycan-binding domain
VRLYTAVTSLSELRSQGQRFYSINWSYPNALQTGDSGDKVRHLQYMLSVLDAFIPAIPPLTIDGVFGQDTAAAVRAAQQYFGLPQTGAVDERTWDEIYDQFAGIENTGLRSAERFPEIPLPAMASRNASRYSGTTTLTQFPGRDLYNGQQDPISTEVIR